VVEILSHAADVKIVSLKGIDMLAHVRSIFICNSTSIFATEKRANVSNPRVFTAVEDEFPTFAFRDAMRPFLFPDLRRGRTSAVRRQSGETCP
jgi:hypothetical protein